MDIKLKQRLIGAIILTSLAIIILPLLLTGTKENRQETITSQIPAAPRIALQPISREAVVADMQQAERASEALLPQEQVDETDYQASEDFMLDKNQLPLSWSLQMGSFRQQENAVSLRARLRAEDYRAYILAAKTATGDTWRVLVGPMVSKQAMLEQAASIEAKLGLTGQIVRYRVEDDVDQLGG